MDPSADQSNINEPNAKRLKIESNVSTSSKPAAIDHFLSLPPDVLSKIIVRMPAAQWPSFESLGTHFRVSTWIAWRQLRSVNVEQGFLIKHENQFDQTSIGESVKSLLQKLAERSLFLTTLKVVHIQLDSDAVSSLAQFEHLQSISLGDASLDLFHVERGMLLEYVAELLESARSRASLKELQLYNVIERRANRATILDRFASSFVNDREKAPLKLEKFTFTSPRPAYDRSPRIRLDTMDTTRLTDIRVGKASIEPEQLINLLERASNLHRIELSFLPCDNRCCNGPRLEGNKRLLTAVASHENLTAIKFDYLDYDTKCTNFRIEFIEMLEKIGRRGQLRKLALEEFFVHPTTIGMNEICATIRAFMFNLQSIKISLRCGISDVSVRSLLSLADLEEIHFTNAGRQVTTNAIELIAQLPHLKRLALDGFIDDGMTSLKSLSNAKALTDLRIRHLQGISDDSLEKWSDGIASKLEVLMLYGITSEGGLVQMIKKAARLRVLILHGRVTDQSLKAIGKSCRDLEILGIQSTPNEITVRQLQLLVDRCPKFRRLGGFDDEIRKELRIMKYRKIGDVDMEFWKYDFDNDEYD